MADKLGDRESGGRTTGPAVRTQDGSVLVATRIERPFLGMDQMLAFIEDTPERWFKRPVPLDAEVNVIDIP